MYDNVSVVALVGALIFLAGLVIGITLTCYLQNKLDMKRIEKALETVGIRRKEFLATDNQVRSLQQAVAINTNRLGYLEQNQKR